MTAQSLSINSEIGKWILRIKVQRVVGVTHRDHVICEKVVTFGARAP